jgi:predicted RNA-binding Zn-ribbon protein involved in translation (DUF1610 family)
MAKKQIECGNCAKKFFSTIINVYISKIRYCTKCKNPTFYDKKSEQYLCLKCGNIVPAKDEIAVAQMGVKIVDATADYKKRDKYASQGCFIEKKEEVEKTVCVRCEHLRTNIQNKIDKDTDFSKAVKDELREMSNIEFLSTFFRDVQPALKRIVAERPQIIKKVVPKIVQKSENSGN